MDKPLAQEILGNGKSGVPCLPGSWLMYLQAEKTCFPN